MNKLIVFPILVMLMIVTINFVAVDSLPSDDIIDVDLSGYFFKKGTNIFGHDLYCWHNNDTGNDYNVGDTDGIGGQTSFNPSLPANQNISFKLANTDTGKMEFYEDYDEFVAAYSGEGTNSIDNIFDTKLFWGILIIALGVTVAAGIKIFGTGFSEYSQRSLFITVMYGSIWGFMTYGSYDLLSHPSLGVMGGLIYIGLTLMYIVGVINNASGGE